MIPLTKPFFNEDEFVEIRGVLDSGWVANGPKCLDFEKGVANYLNAPHAISTSSCTAALHLALLALDIKSGDEVIVSDFSFPATGLSVMHTGATPVFCDVNLDTYNIEPDNIEKLITKKTKAIIPVHTFGNPCQMDVICEIAKKYGLFIIEDAACAFGSKYKNKPIGLYGDIGCFSFHARKGITTGEGGVAVTHNKYLAETISKLSMFGVEPTHGRKTTPVFKSVGYNYKMSDISAAIGIAQLSKFPKTLEKRKHLAKVYSELLPRNRILPQRITPNGESVYQSFVGVTTDRDRLIAHLAKSGIESGIGTYAQHCQPVFMSPRSCKNSETLYRRTISLPMYYELAEDKIRIIAEEINKCH